MTTTGTRTSPARLPEAPSTGRIATGIAAIVKAGTYLVGLVVVGAYLAPRGLSDAVADPGGSLAFLLENAGFLYWWYCLLYVVGGLALAVLVVGLRDRDRRSGPMLSDVAAALGLVWSGLLLASGLVALVGQSAVVALASADGELATSTWAAVSVVQDALGGGIEIVGAAWVTLVAVAGLRAGTTGRALGILGLTVGAAGAATLVPAAADAAGAVFGLGMVAWFAWTGVTTVRGRA